MSPRYDPKDHIRPLEVAPRAEGILDQREITIQSYQTTVPFDFDALDAGLDKAWLTPQIRFGVFSRIRSKGKKALDVVLGLQDELTIRAYDYDARRPLWYSWQDTIVDTVSVHYFRDEDGFLRFTTTGGGRRITDERLYEFNSAFLHIPADAVTKRQFDLDKLRELCFKRFKDRLYMIRFADPAAKEYRSIDHALFQSRQYIDPDAERLKEISSDKQVKIESFDSDIEVRTEDLTTSIQVRFFIRGTSGSLRLRFPKVAYKTQLNTIEDQALVFYRLANATVNAILDDDYYTHGPRSLDELSVDPVMFQDMVNLRPFKQVLVRKEARREFFLKIDLGEHWTEWGPHLQAIDALVDSDVIRADVDSELNELIRRAPNTAVRLLSVCQADPRKYRVGGIVARALARQAQAFPPDLRAQAEETVLSWGVEREEDTWDVNVKTNEIHLLNFRWQIDDVAYDVFPKVLWKLVGVLHSRLMACTGDVGPLLQRYAWCITAAKNLPENHSRSCAALRLVSSGRVPRSTAEASRVLKDPVADLHALDEAVLDQFGLPLWPLLSASHTGATITLRNDGIGAALKVTTHVEGQPIANAASVPETDIPAGETTTLIVSDKVAAIEVCFEKFGNAFHVGLSVAEDASPADVVKARNLPSIICKKRLKEQRRFRQEIDPKGIVVGASPALLRLFEEIHHANMTDGPPPVLLLGEPGVGKTHIAQLLHQSSNRASGTFKMVNAGGGGGDINIQRGEWIGYGKGHGIQGIDKNGRPGHLMDADGGTLFIDEFATLSHDLQVIFLSVLEKRSIEKIGGESFTPNVRCIFATNADVEEEVAKGTLRRDLLDRIPFRIMIPPLRNRLGDVLNLAKHFAGSHQITERGLIAMLRHDWPGNVRELQNKMRAAKAKLKTEGKGVIDLEHLELPAEIVSAVESLDESRCRRELWAVVDEIARGEGFEQGTGLQKRVSEILGVSETQTSKMYREFCLTNTSVASA
ncbi:MAG: hypothetical protein KatS3mg105_0577 [Gemmatales bacterium]|nr:MAG: hypothetical protein KatS3mg105_0577 [Gemmatales bacterium]